MSQTIYIQNWAHSWYRKAHKFAEPQPQLVGAFPRQVWVSTTDTSTAFNSFHSLDFSSPRHPHPDTSQNYLAACVSSNAPAGPSRIPTDATHAIKSQQWNARLSGCDTDLTLFQTFWPDKSQNQKSYEVPGLEGQDQGPAQIPGMFLREAGRGRRDKPLALCRQAAFHPLARGSLPGEDVFHAGDETCVADLFFLHYSLADHPNLRMFCVAMLLLHLSIFSFVLPAPSRVTSSNQSRLHHLAGI